MTSRKRPARVRMWGAFVDGKLYGEGGGLGFVTALGICLTRREARSISDDVRPLTVIIPPRKNRSKP
jgi:hypothetical protein